MMKKKLFFSLVLGLLGFCLNVQAESGTISNGEYGPGDSTWELTDGTLTFNGYVQGNLKTWCTDNATLLPSVKTAYVNAYVNTWSQVGVSVDDINALAACENLSKLYIKMPSGYQLGTGTETMDFSDHENLLALVMYGVINCNVKVSNCTNLDRLMFLNSTLSGDAVTSYIDGCTNLRFIVEPYGFTAKLDISTETHPNLYCVLYANDASINNLESKQSTLVNAGITSNKYDVLKFVCYRSDFPDDMVNLVNTLEPKYFAVKFEYADGITSETAAFTPNDVKHLNTINSDYFDYADIDFSKETYAQLTSGTLAMTNKHVKYGILPHGLKYIHMNLFDQCDSLRCVVSLTDDESDNPKHIAVYSKKPNSLYNCLFLAEEVSTQWSYSSDFTTLTSANIAGYVSASDICTSVATTSLDANGNYSTSGGASGLNNGLQNATAITDLDLAAAWFVDNNGNIKDEDLTLSALGYTKIENVLLPLSKHTKIPAYAFANCGQLAADFLIPGNYEVIDTCAFQNATTITHIYTTEFIEGMGADTSKTGIIDYGALTVTFPAALTHIGQGAFGNVEKMTDVYVISTDHMPTCDKDAFDPTSYYGDNGYNTSESGLISTTGGVTRANYYNVNGGKYNPIAILHFPKNISNDWKALYTDTLKVYSIPDATGATDGDGHLIYWPTHTEFGRVYNQACGGYIWPDWSDYVDPSSGMIVSSLSEAQAQGEVGDPTKNEFNSDYIGWHQFVLAATKNYKSENQQYDFSRFKAEKWYSVCLPYDLSKKDLLRIFGNPKTEQYPDVRTLQGVELDDVTKAITLQFNKKNLADNTENETWKFDDTEYLGETHYKTYPTAEDGETIVMEAGKPYMIKPYLPQEAIDSAKNKMRALDIIIHNQSTAGTITEPYRDYKVRPYRIKSYTKGDTVKAMDGYYYSFIGTFAADTMPQYSIFIYNNKWYRFVGTGYRLWTANSALIGAQLGVTSTQKLVDSEYKIYLTDYHFSMENGLDYHDDSIDGPSTSGARSYTMNQSFSDSDGVEFGTTTGIDNVLISIPNDDAEGNTGIYDLQGRKVGTLQKGVNIVGGKKVVVK